jgi:hypothetical protein
MLTHIGNITHEFASSRVYYREGPPKGLIEQLLNISKQPADTKSPPSSYSMSPQKGELSSPAKRRKRSENIGHSLNPTASGSRDEPSNEQPVEHVCNQKRD